VISVNFVINVYSVISVNSVINVYSVISVFRDQCIYITSLRVGPHINIVQCDLQLAGYHFLLAHPRNWFPSLTLSLLLILSPYFIYSFFHCIANMVAKLLFLYLLAVTSLAAVQAGTSTSQPLIRPC
jgi:hypothetical protein